MTRDRLLPEDWTLRARTIHAIAAEPGSARMDLLGEQLKAAAGLACRTWSLPCDFAVGGPWAGIRDLLRSIVGELADSRPDLLGRHAYELAHVLPTSRRNVAVRHESLTDVSFGVERVRNFPADRAYRFVHGIVDLLAEAHGASDGPWVLACDSFDRCGPISRRFFRELLRRRGDRLRLVVLAGIDPGSEAEIESEYSAVAHIEIVEAACRPGLHPAADPEEMERLARGLEERAADENDGEELIPDLIHHWGAAGNPSRKLYWQMRALELYPRLGFYEDALSYADAMNTDLGMQHLITVETRWLVFFKTFVSLCSVGRIEEAVQLAENEIQERPDGNHPESRAQILYLMAMLHVRFLPERNFSLGEELLERGLAEVERFENQQDRIFGRVFNRNGLALIRNFQGRRQEAIDICREGYEQLQVDLESDKHRLHRSVLIYNIAQVYVAMGAQDDALEQYAAAMKMDPYYSEYYNERGNLYLSMGRLDDACTDYHTAIELSPPYPEVYTNLGQCHRQLGRFTDAAEAYSRALDLSPDILLARVGRAQAFDEMGRAREALGDYDAALELDPASAEILGNRAVLLFGEGRLEESLADLDRAIELQPERRELHENRAFLLAERDRLGECEVTPPAAASASSAASAPSRP